MERAGDSKTESWVSDSGHILNASFSTEKTCVKLRIWSGLFGFQNQLDACLVSSQRDLISQRFNVFQERELKTSLSDFLLSEFYQRQASCSDWGEGEGDLVMSGGREVV